jgi:uncharacterized alkaline shock family protein YloU
MTNGTGPGPRLTVSRKVVAEMVALAALEVPGVLRVGRSGPTWRAWFAGSPVRARVRDNRVDIRLWILARPGHALGPLAADVRSTVAATVERLLGLQLDAVTVVVDGVG